VDVAKDAADVILMRHHLTEVLVGVMEGRRSYGNVMKYLRMGTSSNFGNMFSMAGASLLLPFLPLLPVQVLLNNLIYDCSEIALPFDRVEESETAKPCVWDIDGIRRFMLAFGPLSSVFDFLTFGALLFLLHAGTDQFRTGWFVESVLSASLIVLVVRSRRPCLRSRPGTRLLWATLAVAAVTVMIPYLPIAPALGLTPLPLSFLAVLTAIVVLYIVSAELAKHLFYRRFEPAGGR
jgi:Mg2+-importing ATPase